jgi:hypothetical protein
MYSSGISLWPAFPQKGVGEVRVIFLGFVETVLGFEENGFCPSSTTTKR